jgi:DNA-binding GntR family transcriptional regulator
MLRVGSRVVDASAWLRPENGHERPSRRALADWTLEQIYELFFAGEFTTGDVISEVEIAARLQVSRTPVRLAFQQLEAEGLVINNDETGKKRVATFGVDDIQELYSIRSVLEGLAHREAAGKITPERMDELVGLLAEMKAASVTGEVSLGADFRFHEIICEAAAMNRVLGILRKMWLQTYALVRQLDLGHIYPDKAEIGRVHEDHRKILAALRKGDPAASEQAATRHLQRARDSLLSAAANRDAASATGQS